MKFLPWLMNGMSTVPCRRFPWIRLGLEAGDNLEPVVLAEVMHVLRSNLSDKGSRVIKLHE